MILRVFWKSQKRLRSIFLRAKGWLWFGKNVEIFGAFTLGNPANIRIGSRCSINEGVFILGNYEVIIGDGVVLSARAMLIDGGLESRSFAPGQLRVYSDRKGIKVEDEAWIGAGAIILPGVTIGRRAIVGAGSIVTRDVPPFTVVAGNPARPIGRTDG